MMHALFYHGLWVLILLTGPVPTASAGLKVEQYSDGLMIRREGGSVLLRYQTAPPSDSKLAVGSVGYFHPLTTPSGEVVTDLAPEDHRHHRGIFLGWVEMHGAVEGDFWGWGEHASTNGRVIMNRSAEGRLKDPSTVSLLFQNDWMAGSERMLGEEMAGTFRVEKGRTILDLAYTLTSVGNIRLAQWAFSGFCLRTRKDSRSTILDPGGKVKRPSPRHTDPKSDWPDAPWYAFRHELEGGSVVGVAVIAHPLNPPSLWHNHPDVRMLNPCITAPGEVLLKAGVAFTLRYRVVAWDGEPDTDGLNRLAKEFARKP